MDLLDNDDQPDTLPGFKMQSEHFVLKFITGLQKGVCRLRKSNKNLEFSKFSFAASCWSSRRTGTT